MRDKPVFPSLVFRLTPLNTPPPGAGMFIYEELLSWLRSLDNRIGSIAVVCHNPAITDLVNFLALAQLEKIPTAGVATIKVRLTSWGDVAAGSAELAAYDYPKREEQGASPKGANLCE